MHAQTTTAHDHLVGAFTAADLHTWEQWYYSMLMARSMSEQEPGFPVFTCDYAKRYVLYGYVNNEVLGDRPIDYLEFGVFDGESMRQWLALNPHPASRFYGFDSFEGLPEDWVAGDKPKGAFTRHGLLPDIADPRVSFVKGWFNQTLEPFLRTFSVRNQLVVHMDADLFSSTLYALMALDKIVPAGAVFVFDDFNPQDDFGAFHHYLKACSRNWRVLASRQGYVNMAVMVY